MSTRPQSLRSRLSFSRTIHRTSSPEPVYVAKPGDKLARLDRYARRSLNRVIRHHSPLQESLDLLARNRTALSRSDRAAVVASLFHEGDRRLPFVHRFMALMMLSVLIATLGVLANSTAVVIGAMLVAPLMGPVLGAAAGLVMDWPGRVATSAVTVAMGSIAAIALAMAVSFAIPGDPEMLSEELLARTSPTILDLGVALVAGSAGAYAKVRRQAADAIVGVAVAVALVPPLAVVGITLELGRYQMAMGSLLLFLANVSGMVTAAALTFIVIGLVPGNRLLSTRAHVARSLRLATLGSILVVAPLQMIDQWRPEPTIDSDPQALVASAVDAWRTDVSIIALELSPAETDGGAVLIQLTVAAQEGVDPAEDMRVGDLAEDLAVIIGSPVEVELTAVESNVQTAGNEG